MLSLEGVIKSVKAAILVAIFWNFMMFQCMSISPQVIVHSRRTLISSIINLVYELPHQLLNDLRLESLGNQELIENFQIWVETYRSAQSPFQKVTFGNINQKVRKSSIKVFQSYPILLDFLFEIYCPGLQIKNLIPFFLFFVTFTSTQHWRNKNNLLSLIKSVLAGIHKIAPFLSFFLK